MGADVAFASLQKCKKLSNCQIHPDRPSAIQH